MRSQSRLGPELVALALLAGCAGGAASTIGAEPDAPLAGPQGTVGQFVVECDLAHLAPDDPIVHPGHAGRSHLHAFFGAVGVGADSTYAELVAADTTCEQRLDTASYWAPALVAADRSVLTPIGSVAYYRAGPGVDPASVVAYPPDFTMIAGDAVASEPQSASVVAWSCGTGSLREVEPPDCRGAPSLRMLVTYPDCWDGERLRSPRFTDHIAYSHEGECPASHPVAIPQLQFAVDYAPVDPTGLQLTSGSILGGHADFWNSWDQRKLESEVELCIRRDLVCGVSG